MRSIMVEYSDYDRVNGETWYSTDEGYLVTPHIVLYRYHEGFGFHCFEEAIGADQASVNSRESKIIAVCISSGMTSADNPTVDEIDLVELADMSVGELGAILWEQIKQRGF